MIAEPLDEKRAQALRAVCEREQVDLVHVRSFIAKGPELVDAVKAIGLPLVCSLHDFWAVCPTIQLLDENQRFCAGHCTPGPGPCPTSKRWVRRFPPLKHAYVHEWKRRMARKLAAADAFVTTSEAAKQVVVDKFGFMDDARLRIIEHGRTPATSARSRPARRTSRGSSRSARSGFPRAPRCCRRCSRSTSVRGPRSSSTS